MFWGQTILTETYLKTQTPSSVINNCTPHSLKYGENPDLKHIYVFGCSAYTLVPSVHPKKLNDKYKRMIFIGYASMGYRLLDPVTKHITISRSVKFDEEKNEHQNLQRYVGENQEPPEYEIKLEDLQKVLVKTLMTMMRKRIM